MNTNKTAEYALRNANGEYTIFAVCTDYVYVSNARLKAGRGGYGHHVRYTQGGSERYLTLEAARAEYKALRAAGAVPGNL